MDHLEEEFKKRFKDAPSKEGIDEDKLWAGIANALPEVSTAGRSRRLIPLLLFLALLLLTAVGFFFSTQLKDPVNAGLLHQQKAASTGNDHSVASPELNLEKPSIAALDIGSFSKASPVWPSAPKQTEKVLEPETIRSKTAKHIQAKEKEPKMAIVPANPLQTVDLHINRMEVRGMETTAYSNPVLPTPLFVQPELYKISLLPSVPLNLSARPLFSNPVHPGPFNTNTRIHPYKKRTKKWEIGLLAGGNYFALDFQSEKDGSAFESALEKSHHGGMGYQFSGEIYWKPVKNLRFGTGLSYVSAQTIFEFSQEWDTVMHRNNVPTADLIKARATRSVIHHNRLNYLSLPLTIGLAKDFRTFGIGLDLGIGFNYVLAQSGRSLNQEKSVVNFDGQTVENQPFSKAFFSAIAHPYFEFKPSRGYTLRLQPDFRFQRHGISEWYGLKTKSVFWGLNLGVFQRF